MNNVRHIVKILLSTLTAMAKVDNTAYVEERAWLRQLVLGCADGRQLFGLFDAECAQADAGLQRINMACTLPFKKPAMMMCVSGYQSFCESSVNMDLVVRRAEVEIRRMMYLDWQSQQAIDRLSERIDRNLSDALAVVFCETDELGRKMKSAMQKLMRCVVEMICRLKDAAFLNPQKATESECDCWREDYERRLSAMVDALRADYSMAWERYRKRMSMEEAVEMIENEFYAQSPNNVLIDANSGHCRSASYMSLYISQHREELTSEVIDEYLRWEAGWMLLEEFRNTEPQKYRKAEVEPIVLRNETRIIYTRDVHINTAQGCNIIDKQIVGE